MYLQFVCVPSTVQIHTKQKQVENNSANNVLRRLSSGRNYCADNTFHKTYRLSPNQRAHVKGCQRERVCVHTRFLTYSSSIFFSTLRSSVYFLCIVMLCAYCMCLCNTFLSFYLECFRNDFGSVEQRYAYCVSQTVPSDERQTLFLLLSEANNFCCTTLYFIFLHIHSRFSTYISMLEAADSTKIFIQSIGNECLSGNHLFVDCVDRFKSVGRRIRLG